MLNAVKPFILQNWYENHINISSRFECKLNNKILWISFVTIVGIQSKHVYRIGNVCDQSYSLFSIIQYGRNVKSDILDLMCFVLLLLNSMILPKKINFLLFITSLMTQCRSSAESWK